MRNKSIAIIGTVGIPANYGGFETLAENLVKYHNAASLPVQITVYCSSKCYPSGELAYLSAQLRYVPLKANGVQSIPYDIVSLFSAIWNRHDVILLLGVSGAIALPMVWLFSSARIVTNIDGIEWRRGKWHGLAKLYLRYSEKIAVRFSDEVISDNVAIADYVKQTYRVGSHVIAYGGDHAVEVEGEAISPYKLPDTYAVSVCRIEPENNVDVILEAFSRMEARNLVIVGNWNNSEYGMVIRKRYSSYKNLFLIDPIYNLGKLKTLRLQASMYIHGHSAGGTNPSLVEAMHFRKPVIAFDCNYNRNTTEDKALYFKSSEDLALLIETVDVDEADKVASDMVEIANRRYTWRIVAKEYFDLLDVKKVTSVSAYL